MAASMRSLLLLLLIGSFVLHTIVVVSAESHEQAADQIIREDEEIDDFEAIFDEEEKDVKHTATTATATRYQDFDEDEFVGIENTSPTLKSSSTASSPSSSPSSSKSSPSSSSSKSTTNDDKLAVETNSDSSKSPSPSPSSSSSSSSSNINNNNGMFTFGQRDCTIEVIYASFLLFYGVYFFFGKNSNHNIADRWYQTYINLIKTQFYALGPLHKESQHEWTLLASGRIHCKGMKATISLARRQDPVVSLWNMFFNPIKDTVTIEIPMNENEMPPIAFAIVPESERKLNQKQHPDLNDFCHPRASKSLAAPLSILSDNEELAEAFLSPAVKATLDKYSKLVKQIYFTDSNATLNHKCSLRFVYYLPQNVEQLDTLMNMTFHFVDVVASLQLSKPAAEKARKLRIAAEERAWRSQASKRQEDMQNKKLEKLKKLKEKYKNLPPDQQIKMEEKLEEREKRKAKLRGPKMKIMKS